MKKIFLLAFDRESINPILMHEFIKNWLSITDWWHYLRSCYLVVSWKSVYEMSEEIRRNFPNKHFILIEVNSKNNDGWLPKEAWDWINKKLE